MKIKSLASIACALIVLASFNANAVVNILNGVQYKWLELTAPETLGKSRDDVQAAIIAANAGDVLYGYKYASRAQVKDLLLSYVPWDSVDGYHAASAAVNGTVALIAAFGPTDTVAGNGTDDLIDSVDGFTDVKFDGYDSMSGLYGIPDECGTAMSCESYIELYRDAAQNNTLAYLNSFHGFDDTYTGPDLVPVSNSEVSATRSSFLVRALDIAITYAPDANSGNAASYEFTGTCTDGDGVVTVAITGAGTPPANQDVTCTPGTITGTWDATFDVSSITDGPNALTITASQTDALANTGNADPVQVNKDATVPDVVISDAQDVANAGNAASYPVSGTCTVGDGNVTVAITGAVPANQTATCTPGTSTGIWAATFDVSSITDGVDALTINASQMDAFANTGNANPVLVDKDVIKPGVVISAPATTNNTPFDITITFDEAVTGFVSDGITVSNATVGGFAGSGAVYTATITPGVAGGGNITIDVAAGVAEDAATNTNTAATQAVVTPAGSATNTTISVSATSVAVSSGSATVTITVQAKDANGNNFNVSAGDVTLASTGSGLISPSPATDNNDGTYTATISDPVVETVTISGTISGNTISDTAEVRFFAPDGGGGGGSNNPVYMLLLSLLLVTLRHKHRAVF